MAVDVEALKALGLSDEDIAQIAAIDAGNFPSMTAAPQPVTNRVAGAYDYTPLYGAGDIIPGTTASIFQNLGIENPNVPVFRLLGSENKGGTNVNESMNFAAQPGQSFRLVNKATGAVLGEAATPEGISALVEQSNALSKQLGKKADLSFEQSTGGAYSPIFEDQPNILFDTPMKLIAAGMLAATGAGLLQPGGLSGAGGVGATGSNAAISNSLANTINAAYTGAQAGTAASLAPVYGGALSGTGGLLGTAGAVIPEGASLAPQALSSLPSNLSAIQATTAGAGGAGGIGAALKGITSKMGVTDYLTAASLLGSAVAGGGGGGGATAMPYMSPFGAGTGLGLGTGKDMRVNPNIADYERYGFGPEATFFAPGYSQLVSGAAGAPAATTMGPQGAMVNPQYVPLI